MIEVFNKLELEFTVIKDWDKEDVGYFQYNPVLWENYVSNISRILIANVLHKNFPSYEDALAESLNYDISTFAWLKPRTLMPGEISVLLKHRLAIERIAFGNKPFGLIFEDDIFLHNESKQELESLLSEWIAVQGEYLDIAGGAGLEINDGCSQNSGLSLCSPARTRTNACYAISKGLAQRVIQSFYPLVFPIDWHLQYIFSKVNLSHCYWANNPPVIHGSEQGLVKSWRQDV